MSKRKNNSKRTVQVGTKDIPRGEYTEKRIFCSMCGENLGSYTYGQTWCTGGLAFNKRPARCNCGLPLDWSKIPYPVNNIPPAERERKVKTKWKKP